jgi:hypothetical protein
MGQQNPQNLTEAEMISQSIQTLAAYQRDRDGVPHDRVCQWLDSIGTDNPLPRPKD